jgi:hypothetical protein
MKGKIEEILKFIGKMLNALFPPKPPGGGLENLKPPSGGFGGREQDKCNSM